ncbi:MAG: hypothetical protein FWD57_09440 [Polyangiaceae bacterium]|nr:hypothetical protein [Polyangiaceae bacterium]
MLSKVRKITPLLRSLLLGVAAVSTVSVTSAVVVGCENDKQPEYHIKRLNEPAVRPQAIKRLVQFFEDAMSRADKNRDDKVVQELLDKIIPPMTKLYLETPDMDSRSRTDLVNLLADSRDMRAKPAWIKAIKDYRPNQTEFDLRSAAKAIAETKVQDPEAMDGLIAAFVKLRASSVKGGEIYLDFKKSMVDISSPTWTPQLLERLNRPMTIPTGNDRKDEDKVSEYKDEIYWQNTAAEILGIVKSPDAVKPLFQVVVDPNKGDVAAMAVMAMVKIGKHSMNALIDALAGTDEALNAFAKEKIKDEKAAVIAPTRSAALVIGTVGRSDGIQPLMIALEKYDKAESIKDREERKSALETKAILARELTKCPPSPESLAAFTKVFQSMPPEAGIPPGDIAISALADAYTRFYDPAIIDILIRRVETFKGDKEDRDMVRDSVIPTMIKLMLPQHVKTVDDAIAKWAPGKDEAKVEKEALGRAKKLLEACGEKIECYIAKMEEPAVQEKEEQFYGIKAAYMVAMLGNEKTRMDIVAVLPKIKNAAIKFAAGQALEFLTPNGDQAVADEIEKQLEANIKKGDQNLIAGDSAIRQIRLRILARL